MTPEFLIREANDDDGGALAELLSREWLAYDGAVFTAPEDLAARPASRFSERGGRLWLVGRGDEIVGSLGLERAARPGEYEMSLLCLASPIRGQGLAAALVVGADAFAAASGGVKLNVWVDERLTDGVAFLERQGFLRDPGVRRRDDGSEALDAHFSREIAPEISSRPSEDRPAAGA